MGIQYRKRRHIKLCDNNTGKEYDFVVRYGLYETIHIVHPDNKNVNGTVLFKLKEKKTGKRFIIYTDSKVTSDDELSVYAGLFHPFTIINRVCLIESDEDWGMVECFLDYANEKDLK